MPDSATAKATETISEILARHVAGTDYDALPVSTVAASKKLMLDTLGVAWAGRDAPGALESYELLRSEGGRPEAVVLGYGDRLPASAAAFLNSLFGAALDYDAVNTVHADICALPAALAVAQRTHASGRQFLAAYAVGADLACRLGASLTGVHKGWFTTSIYGVFGAAAAAAKLLGLDARATAHAFGIALAQSAGTQQANIEQALTKRLQSAFATRAGVFSALLAAQGVTGPRESFDGRFGLYRLYQDGDPARVLDGLGQRYLVERTNLKKYPTCACGHAAVDAAFDLVRRYELTPADVDQIEVTHSPMMHRLVGAPFDPGENPQVTGQFSVQYAMACVLARRRLGIEDIQEEAVLDPEVGALARSVRIVVDETNTDSRAPATVAMYTRKHGRVLRTIDRFPWGNDAPPSDGELRAKFDACLGYGPAPLPAERRGLLSSRVDDLENLDDMAAFFDGIL